MRIANRNARYNYELQESFETGIRLLGPEVKSLREGKGILDEAFVKIIDGEAILVNFHIHPYQDSLKKFAPDRPRKLLLHKKEIISLAGKINTNGLTLVPVSRTTLLFSKLAVSNSHLRSLRQHLANRPSTRLQKL
jgi:SsrA-binding protein